MQGSVAAHLRCGELSSYHLTMYLSLSLVVKKNKLANAWQSYMQKVDCLVCPVRHAMIMLKDEKLAR